MQVRSDLRQEEFIFHRKLTPLPPHLGACPTQAKRRTCTRPPAPSPKVLLNFRPRPLPKSYAFASWGMKCFDLLSLCVESRGQGSACLCEILNTWSPERVSADCLLWGLVNRGSGVMRTEDMSTTRAWNPSRPTKRANTSWPSVCLY